MTNPTIQELIDQGALFVANHSGGKDSQATLIELARIVPLKQLLVVHATLGEIEWEGALELAQKQAADLGVPFVVARAYWKDGSSKTFLNMAERRFADRPEVPSFPSKQQRQCTSDLKRGPIEREIIRYMKKNGFKVVVNCEGLRAAESNDRAKLVPFKNRSNPHPETGKERDALSRAGRTAYNWLVIHQLSTEEVFSMIRAAGQEPHWAYAQGNERLSCVFCIFGCAGDLARGAKQYPDLFRRYVELEQRTGYTMHMSRKSLTQLVAEGQALLNVNQSAA